MAGLSWLRDLPGSIGSGLAGLITAPERRNGATYARAVMRDLIGVFGTAAKNRMTAAGWRKRSGEIYTLHLDEGFHAWLGLNRASKHHPLQINPVVGLHCEPLEQLLAEFLGTKPTTAQATLSTPVGYLTPENRFLQLEIAAEDQAEPAAERLHQLVTDYGLPFAHRYATAGNLLSAFATTTYVANPERRALLIPALHYLCGESAEARVNLDQASSAYAAQETSVAETYRRFANRLTARLNAHD